MNDPNATAGRPATRLEGEFAAEIAKQQNTVHELKDFIRQLRLEAEASARALETQQRMLDEANETISRLTLALQTEMDRPSEDARTIARIVALVGDRNSYGEVAGPVERIEAILASKAHLQAERDASHNRLAILNEKIDRLIKAMKPEEIL